MKNRGVLFFAMSSILVLSLAIFLQVRQHERIEARIAAVEQELQHLRSFQKVDAMRAANIKKVMRVLNRYNLQMPETLKRRIAAEISDLSMKYDNLDVNLICATITHETGFTWDPRVVSPKGAMGLMQIMPSTGEFLADIVGIEWRSAEEVLFDPIVNLRLGCRYLSSLIEIYEIDGGLAAYNGGGKKVAEWLANGKADGILYEETQNYIPSVLSLYEQFKVN